MGVGLSKKVFGRRSLASGLWSLAGGKMVFGGWSFEEGLWRLVFRRRSLASGLWFLEEGLWLLVFGFWSLVFGLWEKGLEKKISKT